MIIYEWLSWSSLASLIVTGGYVAYEAVAHFISLNRGDVPQMLFSNQFAHFLLICGTLLSTTAFLGWFFFHEGVKHAFFIDMSSDGLFMFFFALSLNNVLLGYHGRRERLGNF